MDRKTAPEDIRNIQLYIRPLSEDIWVFAFCSMHKPAVVTTVERCKGCFRVLDQWENIGFWCEFC